MPPEVTADLRNWTELEGEHDWSSLLIGNGFSQNIWQRFGYASLFETAQANGLAAPDVALFEGLEHTRNFERVLSALSTAVLVQNALGQEVGHLTDRIESIRLALIAAVHSVHVGRNLVGEEKLEAVRNELLKYKSVFLTNYDLLCYWAIMQNPNGFCDYFFAGEVFDVSNTEIWGKRTSIHFLHGGLHLYRRPNGRTIKRAAAAGQNLLDLFGTEFGGAIPLFVSEGTSADKLGSIYRSDYLSFLFNQFSADDGPLVVFGNSLGESDSHLVDVLSSAPDRTVAISVRNEGDIRQKKAGLIERLPRSDLHFFDAQTHPLGSPALQVAEEQ